MDDCLFDHTASEMPIAAIRGVGLVIIEDSCFLARSHRNPVVDIDDLPDMPSGRVVLQNNVSPAGMEVWLHVRGKRVCSLHCPGERIGVDVETLAVTRGEPRTDREVELLSPLRERRAPSGIHEQPLGHVDDLGTVRRDLDEAGHHAEAAPSAGGRAAQRGERTAGRSRSRLVHAEGLAALLGDELRRPCRLEDDVDLGLLDAVDGVAAALHHVGDGPRLGAGLGREGHRDEDLRLLDLDVVDEAEPTMFTGISGSKTWRS